MARRRSPPVKSFVVAVAFVSLVSAVSLMRFRTVTITPFITTLAPWGRPVVVTPPPTTTTTATPQAATHAPVSRRSAAKIWFVRQGEAAHNLPNVNCWDFMSSPRDPPLTPKGLAQAASTGSQLRALVGLPDLILSSPLRRTVQTSLAMIPTADLMSGGLRVRLHHHLQEVNNNNCDKGLNADQFKRWPSDAEAVLDATSLPLNYFDKPFSTDEGREAYLQQRNAELRVELR